MAKASRILVTGAAGGVGQVSCAGLRARGWQVVGFDRAEDPGCCDSYHRGELSDGAQLATAMRGCDAVLHLAADPATHADFLTRLVEPNIIAVWRVLEVAAGLGIERVVLASSINTANGRFGDAYDRVPAERMDPGNPYGLTKVFLEDAGRFFSRHHGLRVVCARIGAFPRNARAVQYINGSATCDSYLSHHDWLRFLDCALVSEHGFVTAYALSRPRAEHWAFDPEPARALLGYEARDRWPEGLPAEWIPDELEPDPSRPQRSHDDAIAPQGAWSGDPRRVLITGAAGAIGRHLGPALRAAGWSVVGFDRAADPGGYDAFHRGELTDRAAVDAALAGCGALIHLAANPHPDASFDELLEANVLGLWTVLEAARAAGTPRTVLASSINACNGPIARDLALVGTDLIDPGNIYGLSKVFAERAGRLFNRHCGMSVIAVRIGWFTRNEREVRHLGERGRFVNYLSWDDCTRCFRAAIEVPGIDHAVVFALSRPDPMSPHWDLESTRRILGHEPQDAWPEGLPQHLQQVAQRATPAG